MEKKNDEWCGARLDMVVTYLKVLVDPAKTHVLVALMAGADWLSLPEAVSDSQLPCCMLQAGVACLI